jgi:hypothetical protein
MQDTKPRPYVSDRHLWATVSNERGAIAVWPQTANRIFFDIAKSSHLPANLPDGEHGSRVLDIGRGVHIRASGSVHRQPDGSWAVRDRLYGCQYPSGRELTAQQDRRARAIIGEILTAWAATHAGDIAQADDIDRNNGARHLEETIARHERALEILRANLAACEEGGPFELFPDLPTGRH